MGKHLQNPATEALYMNWLKITGLANGSAAGDAVNYGQLSSAAVKAAVNYWTESGSDIYRNSNVGIGATALGKFHVVASTGAQLIVDYAGLSYNYYDGDRHSFRDALGNLKLLIEPTASIYYHDLQVYGSITNHGTITCGQNVATSGSILMRGDYYDSNTAIVFTEFSSGGIGLAQNMYQDGNSDWKSGFKFGSISRAALIVNDSGLKVLIAPAQNVAYGNVLTTQPTECFSVINGTVRINGLPNSGQLLRITNSSGDVGSVSPFDYSGTLSANRTMTLGSNSFIFDASSAASSPGTMIALKGKEASGFTTRFLDYQNESGTTGFRMSANSSLVTLAALNSHNLRLEGVTNVFLATGSDKNLTWNTNGWLGMGGALTSDPSSPNSMAIWARTDLERIRLQKSGSVANLATVEDDLMGNTTQVIIASSHTLGGADFFTRYSASSNAITVTLGDNLLDGHTYRVRCTGNGTNTVTFNAGGSNVFYVDEKSTTTLTTLVCGGSGTGIEAANRILTIIKRDTIIWIK